MIEFVYEYFFVFVLPFLVGFTMRLSFHSRYEKQIMVVCVVMFAALLLAVKCSSTLSESGSLMMVSMALGAVIENLRDLVCWKKGK